MSKRSPRFFVLFALLLFSVSAFAQSRSEYRAYWVETFNTPLGTRAEIDRVVQAALDSNANQIFAQVRRRGDSWYLDSKEPLTQVAGVCEPDASGRCTFDPLRYLIDQAHARRIEVHAYVIIGAIYNAHPTITGTPRSANHVFNRHFWTPVTPGARDGSQIPVTDPRNWGTRSLPHNPDGTTFDGQRYTAEWYVDLGHPDAAAYTVDVLTHLVQKYDVDGIHLDRIRYPEAPINRPAGKPLEINVGYNETSVNRFKARYSDPAKFYRPEDVGLNVSSAAAPRRITTRDVGYPKTGDPDWNNWRREQVTNFVRRLYLSAMAINPRIKISAALICFWTGPAGSGGWEKTEAYYRVFQDWKAWTEEGILDLVMPMAYKREHVDGPPPVGEVNERAQYDDWISFTKSLTASSGRHSIIGLGNYLNSIEGTLIQQRKALGLPPHQSLPPADGVVYYALGSTAPNNTTANSTNVAVTANPYSYPVPGQNTPRRPNEEFFSAVRTGASRSGTTRYEDPLLAPVNGQTVAVPDMPWKSSPTTGAVMGFARDQNGSVLDGAEVRVERLDGTLVRTVKTDGGGFFGALKLGPGTYRGIASLGGKTVYACPSSIHAGLVTTSNANPDLDAPTSRASLAGTEGLNGWYRSSVTVTLSGTDACSGLAALRRIAESGETDVVGPIVLASEGVNSLRFTSIDRAGNREAPRAIDVRIDTVQPTAAIAVPSAGAVYKIGSTVAASFACADATSGVARCEGSAANGSAIDTSSVGAKTFSVRVDDVAGNSGSASTGYQVERGETTTSLAIASGKKEAVLTAVVSPVAPAGGIPSGEVEFFRQGDGAGNGNANQNDGKFESLGKAPLINGRAELVTNDRGMKAFARFSETSSWHASESPVVKHNSGNDK